MACAECRACDVAIRNGHIECLERLYDDMEPRTYNYTLFTIAIEMDQIECIEFLYKKDRTWIQTLIIMAAVAGQLNMLKYFHENGATLNGNVCHSALFGGHVDCLRYIVENGYKWNWLHYLHTYTEEDYGNPSITKFALECLWKNANNQNK